MKVILLRDVAKMGRKHQVVEVADGLALNKLFPKGDAEPATAGNLKKIHVQQAKIFGDVKKTLAHLLEISKKFAEAPLVIKTDANEQEHLFKAVKADDVILAAKAESVIIPKEFIQIKNTIKSLGKHEIELKHGDKSFPLLINVVTK